MSRSIPLRSFLRYCFQKIFRWKRKVKSCEKMQSEWSNLFLRKYRFQFIDIQKPGGGTHRTKTYSSFLSPPKLARFILKLVERDTRLRGDVKSSLFANKIFSTLIIINVSPYLRVISLDKPPSLFHNFSPFHIHINIRINGRIRKQKFNVKFVPSSPTESNERTIAPFATNPPPPLYFIYRKKKERIKGGQIEQQWKNLGKNDKAPPSCPTHSNATSKASYSSR